MIPKNADGKSQGIHKKFTSIRFRDFHTYYYSGVPMPKSVRIRTRIKTKANNNCVPFSSELLDTDQNV